MPRRTTVDDDEERDGADGGEEAFEPAAPGETEAPTPEARRQPRRRSRRRPSSAFDPESAPPTDAASGQDESASSVPDAERGSASVVAEETSEGDASAAAMTEGEATPADVTTSDEPTLAVIDESPPAHAEAESAEPARTRRPRRRPQHTRPVTPEGTPQDARDGTPASSAPVDVAAPSSIVTPPSAPPSPPTTGVEILNVEEREGRQHYTMRDLRNGRIATDVTRSAARRLWRQAILAYEGDPPAADAVRWDGDVGVFGTTDNDGERRYNLALRQDGAVRYFYVVSDVGLAEPWRGLVTREM